MTETNPEYVETFLNFAFDEVYDHGNYDKKLRWMIILASMIAQNTRDRYKVFLAAGLNIGITPEEIMEIVYQAVPYCGIARVFDIIYDTNEVLEANGVKLPVSGGKQISYEGRFEKGLQKKKEICGADIILIGTPVYWYTISGLLKTFIDRLYMLPEAEKLNGKKLYFFAQGSGPDEGTEKTIIHLINRLSLLMKMDLKKAIVDSETGEKIVNNMILES